MPPKRQRIEPTASFRGHAFQALQSSSAARERADDYEWLGDAVIGEFVARCLLSHFEHVPLSARVFRHLCLGVVANGNLAKVYDAMDYATSVRRQIPVVARAVTRKRRANRVEAMVGELVLQVHVETRHRAKYRAHLDAIVSTMLRTHFRDRMLERAETTKRTLSVACNWFTCLPEEHLDETTGELIVSDGEFTMPRVDEEEGRRSWDDPDAAEATSRTTRWPCHAFVEMDETWRMQEEEEAGRSVASPVKVAMMQLNEHHVLRTSREMFDVFKMYGMLVLSERISLALASLHVTSDVPPQLKHSDRVTPATLTRERQLVLSVSNLAHCAVALGIGKPRGWDESKEESEQETVAARRWHEEHVLANTLRAFVGFHSATSTSPTSQVVEAVCTTLYDAALFHRRESTCSIPRSFHLPESIPLVTMRHSLHEARTFMRSKTCDALHLQEERPVAAAALEREQQAMVRRGDCESLDLEEVAASARKRQRHDSKAVSASREQRMKTSKRRKTVEASSGTAGCMTRNLERFAHRRFLFCLEEIVLLFAQQQTQACRAHIAAFEHDLVPCAATAHFERWQVSTSVLTLVMRNSFFRMLLHDLCHFHAILSSSQTLRDGTRVTQLRVPLHSTWASTNARVTTEQRARS